MDIPGKPKPEDVIQAISIKHAAQLLDVDYGLIYNAIREGVLPAKRVGAKLWRIDVNDLREWFDNLPDW